MVSNLLLSLRRLLHKTSAINKKTWIYVGLGFVAVPALRSFYVQELLAALIAFSLLFVVGSIAVFSIFLLVRAITPMIIWGVPNVGRLLQRSSAVLAEGMTSPVWARVVPHTFRRERLKWDERCTAISLRFAVLRPNHIYKTGLRVGGAALNIGLAQQKRMSKQLINWLTHPVTYPDFVRLRSKSHARRYIRRPRQASAGQAPPRH